MVHHKFKVFRDNNPDLSAICHVDFFDSAPDLSEADACHIRLSCLTELAKVADPATKASMALLKEKYLKDKKNGNLRRYWDRRKLEQEAEKSQNEAIMQTAITVNRTATRVVQSAEKQVNGHLKKIDSSVFSDDESSGQAAVRTSSVSSSSSLSTLSSTALSSLKKRKRSNMGGGSMSTRIEGGEESLLKRRKECFAAMDPSRSWKLRSGRTVEEILYVSSLNMDANFKMRSYTIDFGCERTKAAFSDDEWMEMEEMNDFQLPKLPESTERYLRDVRKALIKGQHVASVPVPEEDRYACELMLRAFLSWTQLYNSKPCPFGTKIYPSRSGAEKHGRSRRSCWRTLMDSL
ncbi:MAG: hypothetical protein JOS17DRAFT_537077 [Linnemannia elongata]|nr:MAG: hypothetical protein JOS17DRAFT_537077 [Linnemannia elongata]